MSNSAIAQSNAIITDAAGNTDFVSLSVGGATQIKKIVAGTATLVLGTVTVNTVHITANSIITITPQEGGVLAGIVRISARVAGTSFTLLSTNVGDTAVVGWMIVN